MKKKGNNNQSKKDCYMYKEKQERAGLASVRDTIKLNEYIANKQWTL